MKRSSVFVLIFTIFFATLAYAHGPGGSGMMGQGMYGERGQKAWLGIFIQDLTPDMAKSLGVEGTQGVLVSDVAEGSPAEGAGIKRGDVIIEVNGKRTATTDVLLSIIRSASPGEEVTIKLIRDGKEVLATARLGSAREAMGGTGPMGPGYGGMMGPGMMGMMGPGMMGPGMMGPGMMGMIGEMMGHMMEGMMEGMMGCPGFYGDHHGYGHRGHGMGYMMRFLQKRLDLTDDQVEKVKDLERRYLKESIRLKSEIKMGRIDLKALIDKDPIDMGKVEEKVREIGEKKVQLELMRIKALQELRGILTPEQRKALKGWDCF